MTDKTQAETLRQEYRATMPADVLHLWAKDAIACIAELEALQAAPPAPAAVAVPEALRELIEAIEFAPLGVRAIQAMARARAALAAAPAQAVASSITIDFKQATELLKMFGGEPAEITLIEGGGHSGEGVYAYYSDLPEEGAGFLGKSDNEAVPAAPAQEHATQLARQGQESADAIRFRNYMTASLDGNEAFMNAIFGSQRRIKTLDDMRAVFDGAARAAQGGAA